ncbi:ABC transporter ATP-binding protein [Erysipelothrix urinaevulpis]|uniref:ABC transporter ATP-binding protein n=1 Tax=Erysipelothrix urinaevulpis TaxID=2683717 RepID=UPI00135686FE|nr:ABC transporter ATP-binding protein [Erysipelothrix urinaevulpis]
MTYIKMTNIHKKYQVGDVEIKAVDGVDIDIKEGEFVVIVGPSGAGKTTVMNILGGMDLPSSGEVVVDEKDISKLKDKAMTQYRRDDVGFVFQSYNLIPNLTAIENVELATQISKDAKDPKEILAQVGLGDRMHNFPAQLSGGEQQRVAIARAIAKNPKLLLCDEPTGALDTETGKNIMSVLRACSDDFGMTVVIITHNPVITEIADQVIEIKNGKVERAWNNKHVKTVEQIKW